MQPTPLPMTSQSGGGVVRRPGLRRWVIVTVLILVQIVNYADKSVVGLAAPHIMQDLNLNARQYGMVASSFFLLYAVGGLLVAFLLAPRVKPRKILAGLLVVWSLSQLPIVFAASLSTLVACRMLLGMAEGAGTPTAINACHEWFETTERNVPTALVLFGSTAGLFLAAPLLSQVIATYGWRAAFLTCSLLGVIVFFLWIMASADGPEAAVRAGLEHPESPANSISQFRLWRDGTIIGNFLVAFCAYWIVGFMVAWLAPFITASLGYGTVDTGWILSAVYVVHAAILLAVSYLSQNLLKRGHSSRFARGGIMAACMAGSALAFATGAYVDAPIMKLALVGIATGLPPLIFTLGTAMISEVTPAAHRNRLMTVILASISTAAMISPAASGELIAISEEGWNWTLLLNGGVCAAGALASATLLRPARTILRFAQLEADHANMSANTSSAKV